MKTAVVIFCSIIILCSIITPGASKGPTISSITGKILNFVDEDGRWYPNTNWTCQGLNSGEELKTSIVDKSGKMVAFATWNFIANDDGDWAKITGCNKFGPSGHPASDYPNLPKIQPGAYKLQITAGGKLIWETDFEITKIRYFSRDHYNCTGPWKTLSYFYDNENGGVINFWFEGPSDPKWYWESGVDLERALELRVELLKDGKVLLSDGPGQFDRFKSYPNKVLKFAKVVGDKFSFKEKVLSSDGKYDVVVYASPQYKEVKYPIVNLTFTVKGGEIQINEALSGESSNPVNRCITSGSWYQMNAVKNTIPNYR